MSDLPKLVRDEIPRIARENGDDPVVHVAEGDEYERRLRAKLVEEAGEYAAGGDLAELADVLEVVRAIREHRDVDAEEIERLRAEKAADRGGFAAGYVLESVDD